MPCHPPKKTTPVDDNTSNELEEDSSTHSSVLPLSIPTGGGTTSMAERKAKLLAELNALKSSKATAILGAIPTNIDPLMELKSDTEVHAQVVAPSISGLAIAGSVRSIAGGVCHSLGDQSLGTSGEEINPFLQLDIDSITIKTMKDELTRLKVEYTPSSKKDQLKVLLKEAYLIDPHTIAASYYRQYKGAVYDIKMSKPDYLKLRCTKDKADKNGIWTNFKAARKIIENSDNLFGTKPIMCPGTMILYFKDGKVSQPKFEEPFHQCGCLIHLHNMDLGPQDCRPALLMIGPSELSSDLMTSATHQEIINFIDKNVTWTGLSGGRFSGKIMRKYVTDLAHHKAAYNLVEKVMKLYIQHVQRLYPCLMMVKYGAIKSLAVCPSQYKGHGHRFHTDYSSFYPNLPPHERHGSIILAMDDFNFKHLPLSTLYRKEIIDINVPPAHAIFFPNSCLHSGGHNASTTDKIQLFAYGERSISSPYQ